MPSPFPGMNPYLEQDDAWHSFHERFCTRLADELVSATGPRYMVKLLVARPSEWPRAGIWPVRLCDPLPEIPIPLADPDPDVRIPLQRMLNGIYDAAGYDRFIYDGEPDPPLRDEDAAWARQLLPSKDH